MFYDVGHNRFATVFVYCSVDVRRQLRNSLFGCAKSLLLLCQLRSWFQNFSPHQFRIESLQKIISKCCELVKLCHIDRSGPVFFETQCSSKIHFFVDSFRCWIIH